MSTERQTDKSLLLTRTSGAGSRASAEQFVGSYDLVEFTLVLVGDTIRKSAIRPLKMARERIRANQSTHSHFFASRNHLLRRLKRNCIFAVIRFST